MMPTAPTAGDQLVGAIDAWFIHLTTCDTTEPCRTCTASFNQLRLAYKIWQVSRHQRVTP